MTQNSYRTCTTTEPPRSSPDEFGSKSIGFVGGTMLLINNIAGPTVVLMPALAQRSGWLALIMFTVGVAAIYTLCGYFLLMAIKAMPKNQDFERRVEFTDLVEHYLPSVASKTVSAAYFVYLLLTLMTYIIQTMQVIDFVVQDVHGCAVAWELRPTFGSTCGRDRSSSTPFGSSTVISAAFLLGAILCVPFGILNLDDNIVMQWFAILGFTVVAFIWLALLWMQPAFPTSLPIFTGSQLQLVSTLLFNFALACTLPSWANEKQKDVSIYKTLGIAMCYVVVFYCAIGIVGGMAFAPYYATTSETLFSKLNSMGSLAKFTVVVYPVLQNFTSIPVFSIMLRYNLVRSGLVQNRLAIFLGVIFPWIASVPLYTSRGFEQVAQVGGMFFSPIINLLVPFVVYVQSRFMESLPYSPEESQKMLCCTC